MAKMCPVVHFELPTTNRKRASTFYNKAFGWKSEMLGKKWGNYTVVMTSEGDKRGFPKKPGMINGGMYMKTDDMPAQYPSVVIAVEDIQKAMKDVKKAGGEVLGKPMDIPEVGAYVAFIDPDGNRLSMMQPLMPKPKKK